MFGLSRTVYHRIVRALLVEDDDTIAGFVDQERVEILPINGRRFDDLAVLTPGGNVYNPDLHSSSTDGS